MEHSLRIRFACVLDNYQRLRIILQNTRLDLSVTVEIRIIHRLFAEHCGVVRRALQTASSGTPFIDNEQTISNHITSMARINSRVDYLICNSSPQRTTDVHRCQLFSRFRVFRP